MGFADKMSRTFARSGEETVRMVDHDDYDSKPDDPVEPKAPKERRSLGFGAAAKGFISSRTGSKSASEESTEEAPMPQVPEAHDEELDSLLVEAASGPSGFPTMADTAFSIDDDEPNFYQEKQSQWDGAGNSNASELIPENGAIQDVLDVLKIPATFTIPSEMLMPEDLEDADFDLEVPQGYDRGQVQYFVEKVTVSVQEFVRLLELRNGHVAQLATAVDRLQVDANNLKYDSQIAAGIGIMPTSDSEDLERENLELKLEIQRLKDQPKTVINSEERKLYEDMRNRLAILERENSDLRDDVYELRTALQEAEENAEDMDTAPSASFEHQEPSYGVQSDSSSEEETALDAMPLDLGDFDSSPREIALPESSFALDWDNELENKAPAPQKATNSRQSAQQNESSIVYLSADDDEDDELEKLMKDWN